LYLECLAVVQIIFPENGRGLGYVTPTIFGSTVGYPSDSLASCIFYHLKITVLVGSQFYRNSCEFKIDCNRLRIGYTRLSLTLLHLPTGEDLSVLLSSTNC